MNSSRSSVPSLSKVRLVILRVVYALITFGQVMVFWPRFLSHSSEWALKFGNEVALLAGVTVLMAFGIRYPVRMLPILVFEFVWKCLWVGAIYLPLARAGRVDASTEESLVNVLIGIVVCGLAIPWGYVGRRFVLGGPEAGESARVGGEGAPQRVHHKGGPEE